ncbi:MAG: Lrp/AsnC ligand binding domain-containing protein [Herpetosiphonaceae bacterium]|nr:Lrp/AsnC ligand binding domain-containing protein [Herpetosiphonaceae bacterium]
MVTAFVQIKTAGRKPSAVAQQVISIDGVAEVYSISGDWDVLAVLRLATYEQIAEVVPEKIAVVPGVASTTTILAFRAYTAGELAAAFDIGLS